jgi:hypothetical protein
MVKCTACNGSILFGATEKVYGHFCNEKCNSKYCIAKAEEIKSQAEMESCIAKSFNENCPNCQKTGPLNIYTATKITSYIIATNISKIFIISCAKCGRLHKLKAGLHTLFFGPWSRRGIILFLYYFPAGLLGCLFTFKNKTPSKKFINYVKETIGRESLE